LMCFNQNSNFHFVKNEFSKVHFESFCQLLQYKFNYWFLHHIKSLSLYMSY
jgi:hypothetical protein